MPAYTLKETDRMIELYTEEPTWDRVLHIAAKMRRTPRSVVAKLSKEGVYKKSEYADKLGRPVVTKPRLVADIEHILDTKLLDLDKAPKETLRKLRDMIYDLSVNYEHALAELADAVENVETLRAMNSIRMKRNTSTSDFEKIIEG